VVRTPLPTNFNFQVWHDVDKYNPDQFEIVEGIGRYSVINNEETKKAGNYLSMINGEAKFFRIVIRKKEQG